MAFHKTGVFPLSPDVVTTEMMAPSLEMSYHGHLPLVPSTLVHAVIDLLYRYKARCCQQKDAREEAESSSQEENDKMDTNIGNSSIPEIADRFITLVRTAVEVLASSSVSFLYTSSPI